MDLVLNIAVPICQDTVRNTQALISFHNATSHTVDAPDALCISYININPGSNQLEPHHRVA